MTDTQIDRAAWLVTMAIGVPIITVAHWVGMIPIPV